MKVIAFVDAGTLRPAVIEKRLNPTDNKKLDWRLFMEWLNELNGERLFDAHYYDAVPEQRSSGLLNFHTFLQQELKLQMHLSTMRRTTHTCEHCKTKTTVDEQKGVDVSIAVDLFNLAEYYDKAILVSGDGDFAPVVSKIRNEYARRITVVGWEGGVAPQLRSVANEVIYLENHACKFVRVPTT